MNTIKIDVPVEVGDMVSDPIGKLWVQLKKLEISINNNLKELELRGLSNQSSIGVASDNIEELQGEIINLKEEIKALKEAKSNG